MNGQSGSADIPLCLDSRPFETKMENGNKKIIGKGFFNMQMVLVICFSFNFKMFVSSRENKNPQQQSTQLSLSFVMCGARAIGATHVIYGKII